MQTLAPSPSMVLPRKGWIDRLPLPEARMPLADIAASVWWSWSPMATDLFASIAPALWERSRHNPVKVLLHAPADRLQRLASDRTFLGHLGRVKAAMTAELDALVR